MPNLRTVTRLRPTWATDRNGNNRPDWTLAVTSAVLEKCSVSPEWLPDQTAGGRLGVPQGWSLYGPVEVDVAPHDRIVTPDGTFEVDGLPERWRGRYSDMGGSVTKLVRVDG